MKNLLLAGVATALLSSLGAAQFSCSVINYGPSCGPTAAGSAQPNGNTWRVSFTVNGAQPRTTVVMLIGIDRISFPIPGSSCLLLTNPVFSQMHQTDTSGSYTFSRALPQGLPVLARIQYVEVDTSSGSLELRSTDGLELDCK